MYDKKNPLPLGQQALVIDEGLHYLDAALALNPQFDDAMTYENLLFREKARLAVDPAEKARLTALADQWFERSIETRKRNAEQRGRGGNRGGTTGTGFSPPPPPPPPR